MPEEPKDVNTEEIVTPPDEEVVDSSATTPQEPVESAEAPIEPVTSEETEQEQQVPYDRFKEVNDAKRLAELQNQQLMEMLQRQQQPIQQQPVQDKYAHLTPEEQVFYRNQDKRTAEIVSEALAKQKVDYDKEINSIKGVVYGSEAKSFLKEHPDIKRNSPEAMDILQKMQRGLTMDEAYWAVKGPAGVKVAQHSAQTKIKQQMQAKKKANVEQSSVSSTALPQAKRSFREDLANENFDVDIS